MTLFPVCVCVCVVFQSGGSSTEQHTALPNCQKPPQRHVPVRRSHLATEGTHTHRTHTHRTHTHRTHTHVLLLTGAWCVFRGTTRQQQRSSSFTPSSSLEAETFFPRWAESGERESPDLLEDGPALMVRPCVFQDVALPSLPAVVVFKDGTYLTFDGELFS